MAVAGLSILLYLDHNMYRRLVRDLRRYGFDVVHAQDIGHERLPDSDHLVWAAERGRVILTFDVGDFRVLAERWAEQGRDHAGILLAIGYPRVGYGQLLHRLLVFLDAVSGEEMVNQVRWLDATWDR